MTDHDSDPPKHRKPAVTFNADGLYVAPRVLFTALSLVIAGSGASVFGMFGGVSDAEAKAEAYLATKGHDENLRSHIVPSTDKGVTQIVMEQQAALKRIDDRADRMDAKLDRVGVIMVDFVANDVVKDAVRKNPRLPQSTINRVRETVKDNLQAERPRQATAGVEALVE